MKAADEKRLAAIEGAVGVLARRLLPPSAPDPSDPEVMLSYLTNEELARLEAAIEDGDDQALAAAWDDAQRRAVARMLVGADLAALERRELHERVLVSIPLDEPPLPGRTRMVGYVPDQAHPDQWHVEAVYRGVLPRTLTGAELAAHDPTPWPARTL